MEYIRPKSRRRSTRSKTIIIDRNLLNDTSDIEITQTVNSYNQPKTENSLVRGIGFVRDSTTDTFEEELMQNLGTVHNNTHGVAAGFRGRSDDIHLNGVDIFENSSKPESTPNGLLVDNIVHSQEHGSTKFFNNFASQQNIRTEIKINKPGNDDIMPQKRNAVDSFENDEFLPNGINTMPKSPTGGIIGSHTYRNKRQSVSDDKLYTWKSEELYQRTYNFGELKNAFQSIENVAQSKRAADATCEITNILKRFKLDDNTSLDVQSPASSTLKSTLFPKLKDNPFIVNDLFKTKNIKRNRNE